jgi:hypothetical protein
MPGSFFDPWNSTLPDFEASFGESWLLNGSEWPAIAIEAMEAGTSIIKGGQLLDAHTRIIIREDVYQASGVKYGSYINVRGTDMSVLTIDNDGDQARTLICGPKGVSIWR